MIEMNWHFVIFSISSILKLVQILNMDDLSLNKNKIKECKDEMYF